MARVWAVYTCSVNCENFKNRENRRCLCLWFGLCITPIINGQNGEIGLRLQLGFLAV